ncbi:MAG TPA: hypothetical protein VG713_06930 [Pirellulales bacterium]|nr:hypothetical protein [Pirellulales bacterium]
MQMNTWGVVGCREHRDEIVAWLRESYAELSTSEKIAAIARAAASGLALTVAGIDPVGNLVDEAIRLAEAQQGNCGNT